ncbi:melanocyte-stimulating hormone receptor-like [Oculina patagonica]
MRKSYSRPETIIIINCALNAPLMLVSIIGNTLVLAAILRTPSLRLPSFILLCSLAVSDLLVGLVVQPIYIVTRLTGNDALLQVLTIIALSACGVSLSTMTTISVDRFLALHYHMRYPNLMTTHRAVYTSAILWLITILLSFLNFWEKSEEADNFATALFVIICVVITTVCYTKIYRVVRQHQLQIHAQQQAMECLSAESVQNMQRSKKSAINTFLYYVVMILCYTPLFISMLIIVISSNHWKTAWYFADTVAFMNSSLNPVLYCWRIRELRTAVVKTARQMLCKQTDEN